MKEKFKSVLNENENVIFVTNATNSSVYANTLFVGFIALFALGIIFITSSIVFNLSWLIIVYVVSVVVIVGLTIYLSKKYVNNYFVCLTNERVLIRKGLFTTDFSKYSIQNVSGNIKVDTNQSFFDRNKETACSISAEIELLPVGHGKVNIFTANIFDGQKFSELLEKTVKSNAMKTNIIKE